MQHDLHVGSIACGVIRNKRRPSAVFRVDCSAPSGGRSASWSRWSRSKHPCPVPSAASTAIMVAHSSTGTWSATSRRDVVLSNSPAPGPTRRMTTRSSSKRTGRMSASGSAIGDSNTLPSWSSSTSCTPPSGTQPEKSEQYYISGELSNVFGIPDARMAKDPQFGKNYGVIPVYVYYQGELLDAMFNPTKQCPGADQARAAWEQQVSASSE